MTPVALVVLAPAVVVGRLGEPMIEPPAPARRQRLAGAADFFVHSGSQCLGTKGHNAWGTIGQIITAGPDQCMVECRKKSACAGFVAVSSGKYAGKCIFRGGRIKEISNYTGDERDCYEHIGSPVSCLQEEGMRALLRGVKSPTVLRAVFHDAIDQSNLMLRNRESNVWEHMLGDYGGVDGCLYSPLDHGDVGVPQPSHNRNIPTHFHLPRKLCTSLCANLMQGTWLCSSLENCVVDLTVLMSLETIEAAGGRRVPMTWGRRKGDCKNVIATPFTKDPAKRATFINEPALRMAPSLTAIDEPQSFREVFRRLGFTPRDHVALMGAHSFGQVQVCAGGLNGIEHGPFCGNPDIITPNIVKASLSSKNGGSCTPTEAKGGQEGAVCWAKRGSWLRPSWHSDRGWTDYGFGDGGFFDTTPEVLDNDYFKLFANESFTTKDTCCGNFRNGECHRTGSMERVRHNGEGKRVSGWRLPGDSIGDQACTVKWCRSDRKGRTHMKSTFAWHEPAHNSVKKPYHFGMVKRVVRLAADWALLAHEDTRNIVQQFAGDESEFHEAFAQAWEKVIRRSSANLQVCTGEFKPTQAEIANWVKAANCLDSSKRCGMWSAARKQRRCRNPKFAKGCMLTCGLCSPEMRDDDR